MSKTERRFTINDSVIHAELDDEAMLLNVETGVYFGLDSVGARIWQLLVAKPTGEELTSQLLAEYEVDRVQLHADVERFVQMLASQGLVREVRQ